MREAVDRDRRSSTGCIRPKLCHSGLVVKKVSLCKWACLRIVTTFGSFLSELYSQLILILACRRRCCFFSIVSLFCITDRFVTLFCDILSSYII